MTNRSVTRRTAGFTSLVARLAALVLIPCLLCGQEIRRAIPLDEPPTPPAVPFDQGTPAATPAPLPAATPVPAVPENITVAPTPSEPLASPKSPDAIQFDFANSFYSRKEYELAASEYEKYLSTYPQGPDREASDFRLGECYRALGDMNSAKLAYQTLLDNFTIGDFVGPAAYRLAELYLEDKDYDDAENYFRKASVRVKVPLLANAARFYMARCLESLSRTPEARSIYEDLGAVKEGNPFRDASLISQARLLAASGRNAEALKPLDTVARESANPQLKVEATVKSALLKIDLNQHEKAAAELTRALQMPEIGQWKEVAQIGLMRVLYETAKYKQLIDQYTPTANDYSPESKPEVTLLAANSYRQLGKQDEAQQLYEVVVHDYPDSSYAKEARFERLVSLYTANSPNVSKEADDYLAQNPDPVKRDQVVLLKAEALYKQKDYAGAAPIYACLGNSTLMPAFKAEAQFKLGWCYMQTNDTDRAIAAYTDFLELYPANKLAPSALAQRAVAYQQAKNFPKALRDFNDLIARYPKAKEREFALLQKALTLGQQQDNAGMSDTFKQLLAEYPKSAVAAQANYWIGWAAFEAKDYKNAVAPLEAARKADKEQFFERSTQRIMQAYYYLDDRNHLAAEVDLYVKAGGKGNVPPEMLRQLGTDYLNDKTYDRAEKYLALLVARQGDSEVDDRLNLGRCQLSQNKYGEAAKTIRIFLEQVKLPPARATGLLVLGQALLGLNQYADAQKAVDEACLLQPEGQVNAEGLMLSGDIQMASLHYDEAARLFQKVAVVFDDPEVTPRALEKACIALKAEGKEPEAAKVLNTLQSKYPEYQVNKSAQK